MSTALLEGLPLTSQMLLQFAARQEGVSLQLAVTPPLEDDPREAAAALQERGLLAPGERPGIFLLTPMGYALREAILARWGDLHARLRPRLLAHLAAMYDLAPGDALLHALEAVDRAGFLPEPARCLADLDIPLPTGVGEMTTSAPHAIAAILRALAPAPGDRVLVCGAKGGVTIALCAHMAGEGGQVVGLDWSPGTVAYARAALASHPALARRCEVRYQADVTVGYPDGAPWQAALINGSTPKIPWPIIEQLDPLRGRLLFFLQEPLVEGQTCYLLRRGSGWGGGHEVMARQESLSQFTFTPVYGRYGWDRLGEVSAHLRGSEE